MYLIVITLPLISGIILGLFGRCIGSKGSSIISSTNIIIAWIITLIIFYEVGYNNSPTFIIIGSYISTPNFNIDWEFIFDSISIIMITVVNTIGMCVIIYSTSYMKEDAHLPRFLSYISLFIFSMLLLVCSNNLIIMFIGWEGIGVVSYLLIGFWYTRLKTSQASIKAMIMNRIGDIGLSIGIIGIYEVIGSTDYNIINTSSIISNIIVLSIFIGAIGKSAQLGLHTWLYSAMEGPTPVSALLHAATLVTAGIFLNIKLSNILELNTISLIIITIIGSFTTIFGASMGVISNDIKRIIAFSTMSQLGLMIISIGLLAPTISLFHLFNHAFVKALLFLCAGGIIHSISNEQDLRGMGGYIRSLSLLYIGLLIASLSLGGFPFLSCFYSKDIILESTWSNYHIHSSFAFFFASLASLLTVIYSFKIIIYTFIRTPIYNKPVFVSQPYAIIIPIIILIIPSICIGYLFKELFISTFFSYSIPQTYITLNIYEFIPIYIKLIPIIFSILGIIIALIYYNITPLGFNTISYFFSNKGYFDYIYTNIIGISILKISHNSIDNGTLEIIGPKGISNSLIYISRYISYIHSGYIYHYIIIFIFTTLLMIYLTIT